MIIFQWDASILWVWCNVIHCIQLTIIWATICWPDLVLCNTAHGVAADVASLCATLHRRKWLSRLYLINSVLLDSIFPTKSFWIVCWGKNTFYLVHLKQIEAKISYILIKASTYTLHNNCNLIIKNLSVI